MPVVSQQRPLVKPASVSPLQVIAVVLAIQSGSLSEQALRNLVQKHVEEITDMVLQCLQNPPTPASTHAFEITLRDQLRETGLELMQFAMNHLEPDEINHTLSRLFQGHEEYSRKGKKTRQREGAATLFGRVEL